MIAITSLSPSHKNFENQRIAVSSWIDHGFKVISLNSEAEIEALKEFSDVDFVRTTRTNEVLFNRPYVTISAIIDHLKTIHDEDHFLILNSDLIIKDSGKTTEYLKEISENCVTVIHRCDFNDKLHEHKVYELGFDGFFIHKKWLNIFPQSVLCLGQCFWDFWLPYQCVLANVPVYKLKEPYIYHKRHAIQYTTQEWMSTGYIFCGEVSKRDPKIKYGMDIPKMCHYVYTRMQNSFIK